MLVELPERASAATSGGRPATLLQLNPAAGGAVGVHLAHDHVRVAVTDLAGDVLVETVRELDVDHRPHDTLAFVGQRPRSRWSSRPVCAARAWSGSAWRSRPRYSSTTHVLGSADPAGLERRRRRRHAARASPGCRSRSATTPTSARSPNVGTASAQGVDDFVYVMLSDGVGAGLVLGGRLYEGATGGAGELGHVTVAPDGLRLPRAATAAAWRPSPAARALTTPLALTPRS